MGVSRLFETSATHQIRCNLTGNRPHTPTVHTRSRWGQGKKLAPTNKKEVKMKQFFILLIALFLIRSAMAQWFPQNSGTTNYLHSVYFTDPNTGHAVGDSGTILITTNGGTLWSSQTSNTLNALSSVFYTDAITGYTAGDNGTILKTIDGGTTWIPQTTGTSMSIVSIDFPVEDTGYAVGKGGFFDGSILLKTNNGGSNWFIVYSDTTKIFLSVDFLDSDTGYIGGKTNSVMHPQSIILKTTNGGLTWSVCFGPSGDCYINSLFFRDASTGYFGYNTEGNAGYLMKTTDGGLSWTSHHCGIWPSSIYFPTVDTGFITGSDYVYGDGAISKTTDGGLTWTGNPIGTSTALNSVFFTDTETGWAVGGNGTILKTTNGGLVGLDNSDIITKELKLYPNPSKDKITIESSLTGNRCLSIMNVNSQIVIGRRITNQKTQIDISDLPAGIYFVKLQNENTVDVVKIIKE